MNKEQFCRFLRDRRDNDLKISLTAMRARTGISEGTLSMLERGHVDKPKKDVVRSIARGYKVRERQIENAFYPSRKQQKPSKKNIDLDIILTQLEGDEKLNIKKRIIKRAIADGFTETQKELVAELYMRLMKNKGRKETVNRSTSDGF